MADAFLKSDKEFYEELKEIFVEYYKNEEMCSALTREGHIFLAEEAPLTLFKYDQSPRAVTITGAEKFVTINVSTRNVKPFNLSIAYDTGIDLSENKDEPFVSQLMAELAGSFAEREYEAIIRGLESYAGISIKAKNEGSLTVDDIWNAYTALNEKGTYADLLVMPLKQRTQLLIDGKLPLPRFPSEETKKSKLYYSGQIGMIDVYWARFLHNFSLVMERDEILIEKTDLKIDFEKGKKTKLHLTEWLVSAPLYDEAVAKINF